METIGTYTCPHKIFVRDCDLCLESLGIIVPGYRISVNNSRAELKPYQSIPHISTISYARALRWRLGGLDSWSLSDWFTALAGEVGEAGNIIKKMNRQRDGMQQRGVVSAELTEKLKMEIGDVYIYLDLLARRAGLNLEDCVRDTFNRISIREGFPERL